MKLHVAPDLALPTEAVTQTFALLARRGAGKTHTASVLAEEMLAAKFPIVWIDPIGVAWGLRSKYSILILGGEHADIPLEPTAGKVVAEFIVQQRVSVVLDVSAFGENEMRRFVGDFSQRFYQLNREPIHIFIDEADEFAPQSSFGPEQAKCLGAIQNLVRRGRARGIGCTLITQRSAVLNKSVLTQTEVLIAMQTTGPQDLKAINEWIKYHGTAEECEKILQSLPKLKQGEAWVYSPGWLEILKHVKFRKRYSFDSSRTPKPGERKSEPKSLAEVDLSKLTKEMQATIEKAKADDPKLLRRRIAELKAQIKKPKSLEEKAKEEARCNELLAQSQEQQKFCDELKRVNQDFFERFKRIVAIADIGDFEPMPLIPTKPFKLSLKKHGNEGVGQKIFDLAANEHDKHVKIHTKLAEKVDFAYGITIPKGELAILRACIQFPDGLEREQLTVLTGYKRSSRDAYIQRLKEKEFLTMVGDKVCVTVSGNAALPDAEPLPTGKALQDYWIERLPIGEKKILEVLIDNYPKSVSRDFVTAVTTYQRSSRDAYLQRLKAKQLVRNAASGEVMASDNLF